MYDGDEPNKVDGKNEEILERENLPFFLGRLASLLFSILKLFS